MSQFTQLNIGGHSNSKPAQTPARPVSPSLNSTTKHSSTTTLMAIGGSLATAAFVAALILGTNGCSKSSKQAISAPAVAPTSMAQTATIAPMPTPSAAVAASTSKPAKHSRQHILFAYKNADYGISFLYPKEYKMQKGDKANLEWAGLGPVGMNFVQPGGETLAAVRVPDSVFPGTDFVAGFFNVSVNPKATSEQCAEFAFEDEKRAAAGASMAGDDADSATTPELKKVRFGATEFTEAESSGGEAAKHADARYYHVYQDGACYEFTLGLETTESNASDRVKPLDTNTAFRKLNWMLSTVKITGMRDKAPATVAGTPQTSTPKPAIPKAENSTAQAGTTSGAVEGGKN